MWLLFIAFHLIGLVGYNIVLRKSLVAKTDKYLLATVMQTSIAIPTLFMLLINPPALSSFTPEVIGLILVTIILIIALHYSNVNAVQHLEASVYSVLFNLRLIFTTVLGVIFLGESIVPLRVLGGLLILAAIFVVKQKGKESATLLGIKWGIVASLIISFLQLTEKNLLNKVDYPTYVVPAFILTTVLMWALLLARRQKIDFRVFKRGDTILLMIFRSLSAHGTVLAFSAGALLSVANYLSSMSVIFIVIFGVIFLNERDYLGRKIAATAVAATGLTAILLSKLL